VQVISLLCCGYLSSRFGHRIFWSMCWLMVGIIGFILIVALPLSNSTGRLVGFYLTLSVSCPFVALLSLISSNVAGYTKKTSVAALYLIAYCVGNIIGLFTSLSPSRIKPHYLTSSSPKTNTPRSTNIPPRRRAALPPRADYDPSLLRLLPGGSGLHLVVVRAGKQAESCHTRGGWVCCC
jgi:hypothetical protein